MKLPAILAAMAAGLGGCVFYHQENAALRMPRPQGEPPELATYAAANTDYPSVGGNILKGTSPHEVTAYDATLAPRPSPPAAETPPADQPAAPHATSPVTP